MFSILFHEEIYVWNFYRIPWNEFRRYKLQGIRKSKYLVIF